MQIAGLNLNSILEQVGREKNVDRKILIEALEAAMLSAARKKLGSEVDLEARYNEDLSEIEVYEFKKIVANEPQQVFEISFTDAKKLDPELTEDAVGEDLGVKLDSKEFGRIAAQNAKQIILQRVREAERNMIFGEYKDRKGELITGIVRRFERGSIIVDIGRAEGVIPVREQVSKENIRIGDRTLAYVLDVLEVSRGAQIILSRINPNLVVKLFEQEVPEIAEGVVTIESVAREAGFRTKIIVRSKDSDVDPVGACVGMKGARVQAVVQELRGEKIDIVPFDSDEARLVCNALAPAEVTRVIVNEDEHNMQIVVPDDQLSLAIGRRGQNVRLAAELTGWRIDISSETKVSEERDLALVSFSKIEELSEFQFQTLYNYGIRSLKGLASAEESFLNSIPGFGKDFVKELMAKAQTAFEEEKKNTEKAHQNAKSQAKLLQELESLRDNPQIALNIVFSEHVAILQENGYIDLIDIYLEDDIARMASSINMSTAQIEQIKKVTQEKLIELVPGITLSNSD